jgi:large subunit ribosomal protein L25
MKLQIFSREKTGKGANRKLKTIGKLPAVLYGKKENVNLAVSQSAVKSLFLGTGGKMQVLDLELEKGESKRAIIQDYQYSRVKKQFIHIDFLEVSDNTILHLDIPIRTKGVSVVSQLGGVEQIIRHEIPVVCKAKDIPEYIEIDVSELSFGGSIHVLDIPYPEGVKPIVTGRNFTIVSTSGTSEEVVEEEEVTEEEGAEKEEKEGDEKSEKSSDS